MFRGATNAILILGILLCPRYCGERNDAVSAASWIQCLDDCRAYANIYKSQADYEWLKPLANQGIAAGK